MEPTSVPSTPDSKLEIQANIQANAVATRAEVPAEVSHHSSVSAKQPTAASLLLSTFLSLVVVLVLLMALRYMLPSVLEFSRYSWHRGQLRAEYEMAGHQLESVSWEGLSTISQTVAKRVSPSVVHIMMSAVESIDPELSLEEMVRSIPKRMKVGQGSGIVIDDRGYILTNYHVLDDGSQINVILADERTCVAELVGFDVPTDLAVLKINAQDILPISWGDSDCIEVGSPVWAVGSPFGLTGSVTFGILSSKHRLDLSGTSYEDSIRNPSTRGTKQKAMARYSDLMQSDVAVNPGNSGGPLVNGRGELIGINTAIVGESYRGVSFSIPSNIARLVFKQILESGKMRRGWVGVELVKASEVSRISQSDSEPRLDRDVEAAKAPIRGAVVKSVLARSPAASAGLKVGDTIVEMNGQRIKGVADLIFEIGKTPVGNTVEFTIDRGDSEIKIGMAVGERPE
jgi:S1-C subfamily serine protease